MNGNQRYQVFVSSTYLDLREERAAVQEAILSLRHFPIGMELFPASNSSAWQIIESVIGESDYYVLVIGGCYGSVDENGTSFTEREYDCAIAHGKPIIPFIHGDPDSLPSRATERGPGIERLKAFRTKIESRHHRNYWIGASDLRSKVILSLIDAFNRTPMPGWVRNTGPMKSEILEKLDEMLSTFNYMQSQLANDGRIRSSHGCDAYTSAMLDTNIELWVTGPSGFRHKVVKRLYELFLIIGPLITAPASEELIIAALWKASIEGELIRSRHGSIEGSLVEGDELVAIRDCTIPESSLNALSIALLSTKLIKIGVEPSVIAQSCSGDRYWQLTPEGAKLLHVFINPEWGP